MRRLFFSIFVTFAALTLSLADAPALAQDLFQKPLFETGKFRVGMETANLNFSSTSLPQIQQKKSNWCWAASAQMVFNYYGLPVKQEQLVHDLYQLPVDLPATGQNIVSVMNGVFFLAPGGTTVVRAALIPINPNVLLNEMKGQRPVIAGLRNANAAGGHAYVMTAVDIAVDPSAGIVTLSDVILRDPWQDNPSQVRLTWEEFISRVVSLVGVQAVQVP